MGLVRRLADRVLVPPGGGPNRGYVRAIVLSNHRSGSTMLTSALDAHSRAVCFSEIFNGGRPMFYARGRDRGSRLLQAYRDAWPREFLDRFVFHGYEPTIAAVGFKAFASQIRDPRFAAVLGETIADPRSRPIHLTRRNKLAQYLSIVRATRSGVWSSNDGKPEDGRPIRIDPGECAAAIRGLDDADRRVASAIGERDVLRVEYEDFLLDPARAFARIEAYLGLPPEPFRPSVRKQRAASLAASIENARELRAAFAGTPRAAELDEDPALS